MNREFRLTLCLVALCALPAAATAQGFAQPGVADPPAGIKNDDRRDHFSPPHLHLHVPSGASGPGFTPNEPAPGGPRTGPDFGPTARPSPFEPPLFSEPPKFPTEAFAPRFPEPLKVPTALEHPISIPRFAGEVRSSAGMGRGLVGVFGAAGAGIAALFRGLFGRRKE
jgi:hypothetical protein